MPKICLGCFAEWEEGRTKCNCCGWEPEKQYPDNKLWNIGTVLEKRYLIGKIYYTKADIVVFRVYDNLLGIPCFFARKLNGNANDLYWLAKQMQHAVLEDKNTIAIMAIRQIAKKDVLVFSLEDRYMDKDEFEKILSKSPVDFPDMIGKVEYESGTEQREQVLKQDVCVADRYRIIGCIGIGGFGITYLCEDRILQRNVALKEYFPAEWAERDDEYVVVKSSNMLQTYRYGLQSFMKEARISSKFIHTPHVVTLYDVIEANDTAYIVMEYINGVSIGREMRAKNYKPYSPEEMAEIILPILDGLEEIHAKRIVHSDISPGNIMRTDDGDICLIDLGAAKYNLESQPVLSAAFLKLDYAAPEQYRTAKEGIPKDEGPWTDIYAVGATMYYLLTGHKPTDVISRLSGKTTELVSPKKYKVKLSKQWMKLIHHAMELERKQRIQSIPKFRNEIKELLK